MDDLKDKVIVLVSHEERAKDKIKEVIGEAEGTFFSPQSKSKLYFPLSDGFFHFTEKDVESIDRRLNYHPNLFGINFEVSVVPSNIDFGGYDHYTQIKARRAA